MAKYYLRRGTKIRGLFTKRQIREFLREGKLRDSDEVRKNDGNNPHSFGLWIRLGDVREVLLSPRSRQPEDEPASQQYPIPERVKAEFLAGTHLPPGIEPCGNMDALQEVWNEKMEREAACKAAEAKADQILWAKLWFYAIGFLVTALLAPVIGPEYIWGMMLIGVVHLYSVFWRAVG